MGRSISLERYKREVKHRKNIKKLDKELKGYGLRLLESLPGMGQILMTADLKYGIKVKMEEVKRILWLLEEEMLTPREVKVYIKVKNKESLK